MSLEHLKKNRMGDISKLVAAAEKVGGGAGGTQNSYEDNRIWKPEVDKAGNGFAILRFLPTPAGEDLPWVRYWDHGFQGPGGWYIEKSLTSIGQPDPVGEVNTKLWNSGLDTDKEIARKQKRRLHYVANVLVVADPSKPQNEGKVFLFQFGKKIFDKMMDVMQPQFQDETPINPFDLWGGANFKLKIRNVEGYRNYDKSEFEGKSAVSADESEIEAVYDKVYSLKEFTDPSKYKSYEELKTKLERVLGGSAPRTTAESVALDETSAAPSAGKAKYAPVETSASSDDSNDDDTMSYFSKLANEA